MKQLVGFTGGHPISLDDLLHIQDGAVEALVSMMKGLLSNGLTIPNCILYGCGITTYPSISDIDVAAGALVLDGEICLFDGVTAFDANVAPNILVFSPVDTYAAGDPVVYANGSSHNVHRIRKAQLIDIPGPAASNQVTILADTFINIMKSNLGSVTPGWTYVSNANILNGFANNPHYASVPHGLRYKKDSAGNVHLMARLDLSTMSSWTGFTATNIYQLPVGYRPDAVEPVVSVEMYSPAGKFSTVWSVLSTGYIKLIGVDLQGISYSDIGDDAESIIEFHFQSA